MKMSDKGQQQAGYTLVEMMIVVAIIGILSAIAIPTFTSRVYKSRTAEATAFLGEIKKQQESYRGDWGQYCEVSANATDYNPTSAPSIEPVVWTVDTGNWDQLNARPAGPVRFRYASVAGPPNTDPNAFGFGSTLGYDQTDFWFVSRALGDLDDDGVAVTFESYSSETGIYISATEGWD